MYIYCSHLRAVTNADDDNDNAGHHSTTLRRHIANKKHKRKQVLGHMPQYILDLLIPDTTEWSILHALLCGNLIVSRTHVDKLAF